MHEFSLYGQVSHGDYHRRRMQLAGVTAMQPQEVEEVRLVFKARPPANLNTLPSAGGSQGVLQQDLNRIKTMLNGPLYYLYLAGQLNRKSTTHRDTSTATETNQGADLGVEWSLVFKDTPDAGKQAVSSRLVYKMPLTDGNPGSFLEQFGYEYVSRYMVYSSEFYDDHATIALQQVMMIPGEASASEAGDVASIPDKSQLKPFDPSGGYVLHAWIDVVDGNHPELKDRATRKLLALRDTFKQEMDMTPGDRLALDTKVPTAPRRL